MREIKFKFYLKETGSDLVWSKTFDFNAVLSGTAKKYFHDEHPDSYIVAKCLFTGLKDKNGKEWYFDDLVSNNFGTDKEVIRQIVLHNGCIMLKRIKGNSKLPKYINAYEWYKLNFVYIGNIHQNKV